MHNVQHHSRFHQSVIMKFIVIIWLVSMLISIMSRDVAGVPMYGELESAELENAVENVAESAVYPLERKKRFLPIFLVAVAGGAAQIGARIGFEELKKRRRG
ncbi:hypothetical protein B566_EDAN012801 [Ephemera danica]|nr:hypothetical protein B566_EDAN012801 [Ephemera danica]